MSKLYAIVSVTLICYLLASCKKDTVSTPPDFSVITTVDSTCTTIGAADVNDWTYDSTWTTTESALLTFADSTTISDTITGDISVSPACPNPSEGRFIIGISPVHACKMKLVCVNTSYQILYYTTRRFAGGPIATSYDFRYLTAFHKNENYRIYYGFYNYNDSLFYKGHGDIRIE